MKAVLLAAGLGTRLTPITNSISKVMIPIGGKPILQHIIESLQKNGFNEFLIVVGHHGTQIKNYFKDGSKLKTKIHYVKQPRYLGTAHALNYAKSFVKNEPFLVYLSDTLIPYDLDKCIQNFFKSDSEIDIISSSVPPEKRQKVGNIELQNKYVKKITEKSSTSDSNLAWAGVAFFKSSKIFDAIKNLNLSHRGELEITDAMNLLLHKNLKIKNHSSKKFIDIGIPDGLIDAMKFILSSDKRKQNFSKSTSIFLNPLYFGKNCIIGNNCLIGPNVSIDDNVKIHDNVKLEECIILKDTIISSNQKIFQTIINKRRILSL